MSYFAEVIFAISVKGVWPKNAMTQVKSPGSCINLERASLFSGKTPTKQVAFSSLLYPGKKSITIFTEKQVHQSSSHQMTAPEPWSRPLLRRRVMLDTSSITHRVDKIREREECRNDCPQMKRGSERQTAGNNKNLYELGRRAKENKRNNKAGAQKKRAASNRWKRAQPLQALFLSSPVCESAGPPRTGGASEKWLSGPSSESFLASFVTQLVRTGAPANKEPCGGQ